MIPARFNYREIKMIGSRKREQPDLNRSECGGVVQ